MANFFPCGTSFGVSGMVFGFRFRFSIMRFHVYWYSFFHAYWSFGYSFSRLIIKGDGFVSSNYYWVFINWNCEDNLECCRRKPNGLCLCWGWRFYQYTNFRNHVFNIICITAFVFNCIFPQNSKKNLFI